jgi:hypothetical protein
MAVFIVGMHRSGTSMVAGVLEALGVNFGPREELLPANHANLTGYYENLRVLHINDALTAANGLHWRTLPVISSLRKVEGIQEYIQSVEAVAKSFETSSIWGVKDPRLSFFMPYWKAVVPTASVIVCVRRPEAVARSLNVRNELSLAYGSALWELYTLAALKNSRRMPRVALIYEELLEDPTAAVRKIIASVPELSEIDFSEEAIAAAAGRIQADLDHNEDPDAGGDFVTERQAKLYERLAAGTLAVSRRDEEAPVSSELARLEAKHQAAKAAIQRANAELGMLRNTLEGERTQQSSFLSRVKSLAEVFADREPGSSFDDVIESLRQALRRLGQPPPGFVPASAVDEISALKDERIRWFQTELDSTGVRVRSSLEELQKNQVEVIRLRTQLAEAEWARECAGDRLRAAEGECARLKEEVTAAREESRAAAAELHAVLVKKDQLTGDLETLGEQHARLRRENVAHSIELDQSRAQEAYVRSEIGKMKVAEAELRNEMLKAQQKCAALANDLTDRERAHLKLAATVNELTAQSARLDRAAQTAASDAAEHARREHAARTILADVENELLLTQRKLTAMSQREESTASDLTRLKEIHLATIHERDRLRAERDTLALDLQKQLLETEVTRSTLDAERAKLEKMSTDLAASTSKQEALERTTAELVALRDHDQKVLAHLQELKKTAEAEIQTMRDGLAVSLAARMAEQERTTELLERQNQRLSELEYQLKNAENDRAVSIERAVEASRLAKRAESDRDQLQRRLDELEMATNAARDSLIQSHELVAELQAERDRAITERKEIQSLRSDESRSAERALATQRIAMSNATQLITSLEAEIEELKGRLTPEPRPGEATASLGDDDKLSEVGALAERDAITARLRAERDALEKALAVARKAQASAQTAAANSGKSAPVVAAITIPPETRARWNRQLSAMQDLVGAIDTLLAPKVGGRFWIPVRKIRVKLVQLRQIIDIETTRTQRSS